MRVSVIQLNSRSCVQNNLDTCLELIRKEYDKNLSELILLPENCLFFGGKPNDSIIKEIESAISQIQKLADHTNAVIVVGSVPVCSNEPGKFYNRSYVLRPNASFDVFYDKKHLFDVEVADGFGSYKESETFTPGSSDVVHKIEGSDFALGLSICFDLRFSQHYVNLKQQGANVLSIPSAFTYVTGKAHWEVLLKARAIENQSYVIAANQWGTHDDGRKTWGHSMIIDPWGDVIAEIKDGVGACYAELDSKLVNKIRARMPL